MLFMIKQFKNPITGGELVGSSETCSQRMYFYGAANCAVPPHDFQCSAII